jgi:hypothetical protein
MGVFILTMLFSLTSGPAGSNAMTSIQVEYNSAEACEAAKSANRESLNKGSVILSTCTRK